MNLVDAVVVEEQGGRVARAADGVILPLPARCAVIPGAAVTWGVRPEHVLLASPGTTGMVASVEQTGAETHVTFVLGADRLTGVFRERVGIARGDRVSVTASADHVHVFDRQTGRRID